MLTSVTPLAENNALWKVSTPHPMGLQIISARERSSQQWVQFTCCHGVGG
jgi:hypothetical protein